MTTAMNEMLEKVCFAIGRASGYSSKPVMRKHFEKQARAAIEAMREPTQAMFLEAEKRGVSFATQQRVWPAMIDAAVAEVALDLRQVIGRAIANCRGEGWTVTGSFAKGSWRVAQGGDVRQLSIDELLEFSGYERPA